MPDGLGTVIDTRLNMHQPHVGSKKKIKFSFFSPLFPLSLFPRDPRFLLPLSLLSRSDAALLFSFQGGRVEQQPKWRRLRGGRAEQLPGGAAARAETAPGQPGGEAAGPGARRCNSGEVGGAVAGDTGARWRSSRGQRELDSAGQRDGSSASPSPLSDRGAAWLASSGGCRLRGAAAGSERSPL